VASSLFDEVWSSGVSDVMVGNKGTEQVQEKDVAPSSLEMRLRRARDRQLTAASSFALPCPDLGPSFYFEFNPQPMWIYDVGSLRFVAVNSAAIEKYGYTRAEFLAMTIEAIRPRLDRPRLFANLEHCPEDHEVSGPWTHIFKDGTEIQVEISSQRLPPPNTNQRLVVAWEIRRDVSIADLRSQFLNSVNHAARTPLTAIFGLSELLLSGCLDESQRRDLLEIRRCSQTVLDLMVNVFQASAAELGKSSLAPAIQPPAFDPDPVTSPDTGGGRVLVADDNRINRLLLVRMLEKAGVVVDTAEDGEQALKMWVQQRYPLIFMDCAMPRLDGYQATTEIRKREDKSHTGIIAVTAHTGADEEKRCFDCGMDAYLAKPFEVAHLHNLLFLFRRCAPASR
jgi:PAS domain S-box-containing protein